MLHESLNDAWLHADIDGTPKPHLHICVVYSGRTTEHHIHALLTQTLGLPFEAVPLMQPVQDVANLARYFEHKTDAAKDKQQFTYGNAFFGGFSIDDPHAMVATAISVARKIGELHVKTMRDIMLSEAFTQDEKSIRDITRILRPEPLTRKEHTMAKPVITSGVSRKTRGAVVRNPRTQAVSDFRPQGSF